MAKKKNLRFGKKRSGDAGYRSPYLSHAKRALYNLSYIPITIFHWTLNCCNESYNFQLVWSRSFYHSTSGASHRREITKLLRRLLLQASTSWRRLSNAYYHSVPPRSHRFFSSSSSSQSPNSSLIEHVEDNANHSPSPPSAPVSADRSGLYNPHGNNQPQ